MEFATIFTAFNLVIGILILGGFLYLLSLLIRALRKYLKAEPVRKEKEKVSRDLGEVLREHRTACRMTQEFVAESLGVSRQAVSKWEKGLSDPSTSNLMALAKLFGTTAEAILAETRGESNDN